MNRILAYICFGNVLVEESQMLNWWCMERVAEIYTRPTTKYCCRDFQLQIITHELKNFNPFNEYENLDDYSIETTKIRRNGKAL